MIHAQIHSTWGEIIDGPILNWAAGRIPQIKPNNNLVKVSMAVMQDMDRANVPVPETMALDKDSISFILTDKSSFNIVAEEAKIMITAVETGTLKLSGEAVEDPAGFWNIEFNNNSHCAARKIRRIAPYGK